jgi:hypothetical protein
MEAWNSFVALVDMLSVPRGRKRNIADSLGRCKNNYPYCRVSNIPAFLTPRDWIISRNARACWLSSFCRMQEHILDVLERHPDIDIRLSGHTDISHAREQQFISLCRTMYLQDVHSVSGSYSSCSKTLHLQQRFHPKSFGSETLARKVCDQTNILMKFLPTLSNVSIPSTSILNFKWLPHNLLLFTGTSWSPWLLKFLSSTFKLNIQSCVLLQMLVQQDGAP